MPPPRPAAPRRDAELSVPLRPLSLRELPPLAPFPAAASDGCTQDGDGGCPRHLGLPGLGDRAWPARLGLLAGAGLPNVDAPGTQSSHSTDPLANGGLAVAGRAADGLAEGRTVVEAHVRGRETVEGRPGTGREGRAGEEWPVRIGAPWADCTAWVGGKGSRQGSVVGHEKESIAGHEMESVVDHGKDIVPGNFRQEERSRSHQETPRCNSCRLNTRLDVACA